MGACIVVARDRGWNHVTDATVRAAPALRDQFGRSIEYLRISVTDRCNFRCVYCMPLEGLDWLPKAEILTYEEITETVRQLAPLGLRRLRVTGGEPTIRPNLVGLIAMLRAVPGIEDIALSTNGVKLPQLAAALAAAGLDRVNVSADSLQPTRISRIARRNLGFEPVTALRSALEAGLRPVKFNVVVMRGINDDEIADFARLTLDHEVHVRFIELMPVGEMAGLTWEHVVPSDEVLERAAAAVGSLEPTSGPRMGNGPAKYHQAAGAPGTIGVITPMSHTYCGTCNRVRLTADGRLRTCLYGDHEVNLRDPLRAGRPLGPLFEAALADKPKEHHLLQMQVGGLKALSQVGG
jgi:cyclic pyranopterin phosphate synthase